jgi:protein phosphatase
LAPRSPAIIAVPADALVICCGPAGSGKSTFARRHFLPTQVVSSDACRAMVGDDEANQAISGRAFDLFHRIIEHRLALGRLTVADSTAISPRARGMLRRLARRHGRAAILVAFNSGLSTLLANNRKRARTVPTEVLRLQRFRFREESPRFPEEGYATIYHLDARALSSVRVRVKARARQGC